MELHLLDNDKFLFRVKIELHGQLQLKRNLQVGTVHITERVGKFAGN